MLDKYRRWIEQVEASDEYQRAGLQLTFTEELSRVMEEKGVTRAELARRAGTSPAYITKILRGTTNFTLATMAKLARALGTDVRLHLAPKGAQTVWKDSLRAPSAWPGAREAETRTRHAEHRRSEAPSDSRRLLRALARDDAREERAARSSYTATQWKEARGEDTADQVA